MDHHGGTKHTVRLILHPSAFNPPGARGFLGVFFAPNSSVSSTEIELRELPTAELTHELNALLRSLFCWSVMRSKPADGDYVEVLELELLSKNNNFEKIPIAHLKKKKKRSKNDRAPGQSPSDEEFCQMMQSNSAMLCVNWRSKYSFVKTLTLCVTFEFFAFFFFFNIPTFS